MRPIYLAIAALLGATVLSACETVEGFGRDVETAGDVIQEESNEVQY